MAVRLGQLDTVKCLMMSGASLEDKAETGQTALHLAAAHGHTKLVD